MRKILIIIFISLLLNNKLIASHKFVYTEVIICAPKKVENISDLPDYAQWKFYYIHLSNNEDIAILNDGYEYNTFEKRHYTQLWNQNQKTTSLEYQKDEITNIFHFKLINEYDPIAMARKDNKNLKVINHFNFSLESMTFSMRNVAYPSKEKYEPVTGVCWNQKSY